MCVIKKVSKAEELQLVFGGNSEVLNSYIKLHQLTRDAEVAFMKYGDVKLVKWYVGKYAYLPVETQEALVGRGDHDLIMTYIGDRGFEYAAELALVKRGNHDEIMAYIGRWVLYHGVQVALVERGDEDEILTHAAEHGLCTDAKAALDERNNGEKH